MTIAAVDASPAPPDLTSRTRLADPLLALLVAAFVLLLGTMIALLRPHFFYVGDNPESFIPMWHHFGTELLSGRWNTMEASGWMGGNYAGEAGYAQWNPLYLLAYVIVALFPDLAVGAAVIMIAMLGMLAVGAFGLLRSYAVAKAPATALACAVPFTGFTLYYEAAGWPAGLAALVGVTFFWIAVRKQTEGRWAPLVTFVFGYLAVTTGNPYALLGVLIVLAAFFIELAFNRRWRDAIHLVIVGALIGSVALLVFLPLVGVLPVTARQQLAFVANDTFLVPDLGDLAAGSTPSYLPTITNWGGALIEYLPSTYFAWFALPLLPWVRWKSLWRALRENLAIIVMGGIFGLTVLGPSNLWLFRWPIRLIEYFYLVVMVILGLAISNGLHRSFVRGRLIGSGVVVAFGAFLAFSTTPGGAKIHAVSLVLCAGLLTILAWVWRARGLVPAMGVLLAGTALVVSMQVVAYPRGTPVIVTPSNLAEMEAQGAGFEGTVLQLAQQSQAGPDATNTAKLMFGNLSAPLEYESVNRYSGISFEALSTALCIDYKGVTCPEVYDRLLRPVANTQGDLADALNLGTLVIQRAAFSSVIDDGPPEGWRQSGSDDVRVVWTRDSPLAENGRVSGTSPGVTARSVVSTEMGETVDVTAASDGYVTFARLAWPGYSIQVDGTNQSVSKTDEGLLQVAVPAGSSRVVLTYTTPGLVIGWISTAVAALLAAIQSIVWQANRKNRRVPVAPSESSVHEPAIAGASKQ